MEKSQLQIPHSYNRIVDRNIKWIHRENDLRELDHLIRTHFRFGFIACGL